MGPAVPDAPATSSRPVDLSASEFLALTLRGLDAELAPTIPRVLASAHAAPHRREAGARHESAPDDGADAEAIHDLRVAIRRLRTLLKRARRIYGRFHADAVRAAFTTVHRATGALRDEEVLEETLTEVPHAALAAWLTRRKVRERVLRSQVVARIEAGDLARARNLLEALVTLPVAPKKDEPAAKFARRAVNDARRGVESLRDTPVDDVLGLHALRIAYKELRYSAELFASALPADLAALGGPAAKFQKRLGEVHDVDMALATIKRARGLGLATQGEILAGLETLRAKHVAKYEADMARPPAPKGEREASETAGATRPTANPRGAKARTSGAARRAKNPANATKAATSRRPPRARPAETKAPPPKRAMPSRGTKAPPPKRAMPSRGTR